MREHFEAVEADFQAHYGLDLRAVLWGPRAEGTRRIMSLIRGLPPTGAVFREMVTGGRDWSTGDELLATLIELTDMTNRLLFSANSKKGTKVWDPVDVRRPYEAEREPEAPVMVTGADLAAFLGEDVEEVIF